MAYQQGTPGQQPHYGYAPPPPRRTNGLAIAALVLGLTGFITCGFTSILAVAFGHTALRQIRRDGTDGREMAFTGVVLGWILTGLWILYWLLVAGGIVASITDMGSGSAGSQSTADPERTRLTVSQPAATAPSEPEAQASREPDPKGHEVTFEAVGQGGATSALNITYTIGFDIKQESGVPLPYTKSLRAEESGPLTSLWVQNADDKGSVTCRIKVDGKTLREATSSGPYGVCRVQADSLGQ